MRTTDLHDSKSQSGFPRLLRKSDLRSINTTRSTSLEVPEQSLLAQFFFRFHDLVFFFLLRKDSIDFFLQFSSIYLSISNLHQFSLNFFNLLQFTSCSKLLSPIFSFFLTSHSCLTFNFVKKNLTDGSHPRQPTSSTVPP